MLAQRVEQWKQQWKAEGLESHARDTLQRQLSQRFGALPEAVQQRIEQASQTQLDAWLDQVISAPTLASIFGDDALQ